uniref:DUF5641 domain-containing protein n=1 Tax=Panagrolaimus davidi TaxID=227884 RepID=A0A914PPS9_9BILA
MKNLVLASFGEIIIVQDDDLLKTLWKLAKIIQLHTSPDGEIHSATVLFQTGNELRRLINLLYPLEIRDSAEDLDITDQLEILESVQPSINNVVLHENISQKKIEKTFKSQLYLGIHAMLPQFLIR